MVIKHTIVYAENDFDDYYLLKSAFEDVRKDIDLIHVDDGWELLQHLQNLKLPSLYPSLVILDINMEGIGGKETLKIMKSNRRYQHIPVVMFSASRSDKDKAFCKEYGIELHTKPSSFGELIEKARFFADQCDEFSEKSVNV
jgi:CheY-like chemotaxis protein